MEHGHPQDYVSKVAVPLSSELFLLLFILLCYFSSVLVFCFPLPSFFFLFCHGIDVDKSQVWHVLMLLFSLSLFFSSFSTAFSIFQFFPLVLHLLWVEDNRSNVISRWPSSGRKTESPFFLPWVPSGVESVIILIKYYPNWGMAGWGGCGPSMCPGQEMVSALLLASTSSLLLRRRYMTIKSLFCTLQVFATVELAGFFEIAQVTEGHNRD